MDNSKVLTLVINRVFFESAVIFLSRMLCVKGSFRKSLQKELKTWVKPCLVVIFIFISDELFREYISKKCI